MVLRQLMWNVIPDQTDAPLPVLMIFPPVHSLLQPPSPPLKMMSAIHLNCQPLQYVGNCITFANSCNMRQNQIMKKAHRITTIGLDSPKPMPQYSVLTLPMNVCMQQSACRGSGLGSVWRNGQALLLQCTHILIACVQASHEAMMRSPVRVCIKSCSLCSVP